MASVQQGRFQWFDVMSTDPAASRKFYEKLLGWQVNEMDMGGGFKYLMLIADGVPFGGIVPLEKSHGIPSHWVSYISTDDVDAFCKKAAGLGGQVCVPPTDIPNVGRFAVVSDPTGGTFSPFKGAQPDTDIDKRRNVVCWNELMSADRAKAASFYGKMFGWGVTDNPMNVDGNKFIYSIFSHKTPKGAPDMTKMEAGCMDLTPDMRKMGVPSHWLNYFFVPDVDARTRKAAGLGANIHVQPMDIPGIGRFSVVQEPAGAVFALFSAPPHSPPQAPSKPAVKKAAKKAAKKPAKKAAKKAVKKPANKTVKKAAKKPAKKAKKGGKKKR